MINLQSTKTRQHLFPIIILILYCFLLSLPTINYGYHLEDYAYLRSYSLSEIADTFHSHWEPSQKESKGYRPLHSIQYGLFHLLIGGDPILNHILHIIIFSTAIILLYYFTYRITKSRSAGLWTAIIYSSLGTTAWQVTWLVNRQHLLQVIFFLSMLISFDLYLVHSKATHPSRSRLFKYWIISFVFYILALLLKETAVTYPFIVFSFAVIVRKKKIQSLLKTLAPFFISLILFLIIRHSIVKDMHTENPPPVSTNLMIRTRELYRAVLTSLVQTQGAADPLDDWPFDYTGFGSCRDCLGLAGLIGILAIGGTLAYPRISKDSRKSFIFGLAIILIAGGFVSLYLRAYALFISSIGVALIIGIVGSILLRDVSFRRKWPHFPAAYLAAGCFFLYLAMNLWAFFENEWALRPYGFQAITWDYDVSVYYLPRMKEEQMLIYKDKLRRMERWGLLEKVNEAAEGTNPVSH